MMTDFEDKMPAAPRSMGTWIEMVLIGGVILSGYFGMARTLWSWVVALFS